MVSLKIKKKEKFKDERILRTIFNQKLNEEGNIIDTDGDEGLAITLVTEIIPPKQLSFEESRNKILERIKLNKQTEKALKKAGKIKEEVESKKISFTDKAKELNLDVLVEVHDAEELVIAQKVNADIIGINNRNLKNFKVDINTCIELSKNIHKEVIIVAESGIKDSKDIF